MKPAVFIFMALFCTRVSRSLQAQEKHETAAYFVSSLHGTSSGTGTPSQPWGSLTSINKYPFNPGDTIYFERGSGWTGSFEISASGTKEKPIVFSSYGSGSKPSISNTSAAILDGNAIRVSADYIVIDGFYIHDCAGTDPRRLAAIGNIDGRNHHITVQNCETKGCKVGIRIYAHDVLITKNYLHGPGGAIDRNWGPMGIVGVSYNVEISYNQIEDFLAVNHYGYDGGAIEIDDDGPKYNWRIHHNSTIGNEGFLESIDAGECPTCTYSNFFIYYNFSDDYQWWVDGPIGANPVLENNTVIRTRPKNSEYNLCLSLHTDVPGASIKNNIFVVANGIKAFNRNAPGANNIFYSSDSSVPDPKGFALAQNEIIADPQFVDISKQNYHLKPTSPAINRGADLGYMLDLDSVPVPQEKIPDAGAYEYTELTHGGHYYINSQTGNDNNTGTTLDAPWKSLKKLEDINFIPGDSILFAKGSAFTGGVVIKSSGTQQKHIVFSSYGAGEAPLFTNPDYGILNGNVFQLTSSYITINGLHFEHTANYTGKSTDGGGKRGEDKKILLTGAIYQQTAAHHLTVQHCVFNDCPIGVYINGMYNLITYNYFHDCNRFLWVPDWGPIALVVGNAFNEISYNTCKNYVSVGGNFGADGGFIELDSRYYGGPIHDIEIHHNYSEANEGFMEVTNAGKDLHVFNNISDDFQQFIFFWSGDSSLIENNTVIRTRPANATVNVVLTFRKNGFRFINNIFVVADSLKVFGSGAYDAWNFDQLHEDNLYFSIDGTSADPVGRPPGKGEIIADPLFLDYINKDFRLQPGSPAKDKGAKDLNYKIN